MLDIFVKDISALNVNVKAFVKVANLMVDKDTYVRSVVATLTNLHLSISQAIN